MKQGFTLLELVVVIIIIGILATVGAAQYTKTIERSRAAEAIYLLGVLRSAQLRYALEHGNTTTTMSDLDVKHTTLKYFNNPSGADVNPEASETVVIANMTRNNVDKPYGVYNLSIQVDGNITCTDSDSGVTCGKVGY